MNNTISIIVPVYNAGDYLINCIESIINQAYKDVEILLIDDGSSDNSGEICDKYAKKDARIKVIHKKNGGQSSARNVGIDHATGDRIVFIDSDDYVSADHISFLDENYRKYLVQVVCTPVVMRYPNGRYGPKNNFDPFVTNGLKAMEISLRGYYSGISSSGKLFDTQLVKRYRYPEGEIYEDQKIIPFILRDASSVLFADYGSYFYNQHSMSTMHFTNDFYQVEGMIAFYNDLISQTENREIQKAAVFRLERNVKEYCWRIRLASNKNEIRKLINVLKRYKYLFWEDSLNSTAEKIKYRFLSSNIIAFYFFCFAQRIKIKIKEQ